MPKRVARALSGRRVAVNTRVTREVREGIEAASIASGRSLSHEIEWRLERSLQADDLTKTVRETVRQEMKAEFEARREPAFSFTPSPLDAVLLDRAGRRAEAAATRDP